MSEFIAELGNFVNEKLGKKPFFFAISYISESKEEEGKMDVAMGHLSNLDVLPDKDAQKLKYSLYEKLYGYLGTVSKAEPGYEGQAETPAAQEGEAQPRAPPESQGAPQQE